MRELFKAIQLGRETARAKYGRPAPQPQERVQPETQPDGGPRSWAEEFGLPDGETQLAAEQARETGELRARVADLNVEIARLQAKGREEIADQAGEVEALRAYGAELTAEIERLKAESREDKAAIAALTEGAEKQERDFADMDATYQPLINVLMLPGVKKWLLKKFHPQEYPDANEAQRTALDEALLTINAAYDVVKQASRREE